MIQTDKIIILQPLLLSVSRETLIQPKRVQTLDVVFILSILVYSAGFISFIIIIYKQFTSNSLLHAYCYTFANK